MTRDEKRAFIIEMIDKGIEIQHFTGITAESLTKDIPPEWLKYTELPITIFLEDKQDFENKNHIADNLLFFLDHPNAADKVLKQEITGAIDTGRLMDEARQEDIQMLEDALYDCEKGAIYFAQAVASGLIKIGITKDVNARIRALTNNTGGYVKLLTVYSGVRADETREHKRFNDLREEGEWFRPEDQLLNYIKLISKRG